MKVLLALDAGPESLDALSLALALLAETDGSLVIASINESGTVEAIGDDRHLSETEATRAFAVIEALIDLGDFERATTSGPAADGLAELADAYGADVVVLGSTHRGRIGQIIPGATLHRLLTLSPCPIAVAPRGYGSRRHPPIAAVGFPTRGDGTEDARRFAVQIASLLGAELYPLEADPGDDLAQTLITRSVDLDLLIVSPGLAERVLKEAVCPVAAA